MLTSHEKQIIRQLAAEYAAVAALPVQREKRQLWMDLNEIKMQRPMVLLNELPWTELSVDDSLQCRVTEPYWRGVESNMRQLLYRWKHFAADQVFEDYICLPRPIPFCVWNGMGWGGIEVKCERRICQKSFGQDIASSSYINQISCMEDVERIREPEIHLDREKEAQIIEEAKELFAGIIDFRMTGISVHLGIWDSISMWMGVENCYFALMDEPELIHALMEKLTIGLIHMVEKINAIEAIDINSHFCHCSQTYLRDFPKENCKAVSQNAWACGHAQLFTSVSTAITKEFEVDYMRRIFPYFGAIYYGCCDRMDNRMDAIRLLPRLRKLACSPWSDAWHFAEVMPDYCVMSVKPNPAFIAGESVNESVIRDDLRASIAAAAAYNRSVEFILKDVCTVRNDPSRLDRWTQIAMEEVCR